MLHYCIFNLYGFYVKFMAYVSITVNYQNILHDKIPMPLNKTNFRINNDATDAGGLVNFLPGFVYSSELAVIERCIKSIFIH